MRRSIPTLTVLVVAGLAGLAALPLALGHAQAPPPATVRVIALPITNFTPLLIARDKGWFAAEPGERGRHVAAQQEGEADGEGAGEGAVERLDVLLQRVQAPERFLGVAAKLLAGRRQPGTVVGALDEDGAQRSPEGPELQADRGLARAQLAGRPGQAARSRHREERPELIIGNHRVSGPTTY